MKQGLHRQNIQIINLLQSNIFPQDRKIIAMVAIHIFMFQTKWHIYDKQFIFTLTHNNKQVLINTTNNHYIINLEFSSRFLSQQNTHSPESFHCSSSLLWFSCQRTPTVRRSRSLFPRPTTENCVLLPTI
jgi:hypothetical protein